EHPAKTELIVYSPRSRKLVTDPFVVSTNSRMDCEPSVVKAFSFRDEPATLNRSRPWRASVVNSMDSMLTLLTLRVPRMASLREFCEFSSPHRFSIVDVQVDP